MNVSRIQKTLFILSFFVQSATAAHLFHKVNIKNESTNNQNSQVTDSSSQASQTTEVIGLTTHQAIRQERERLRREAQPSRSSSTSQQTRPSSTTAQPTNLRRQGLDRNSLRQLKNEYLTTTAQKQELSQLYRKFQNNPKLIHSQKALQRALAFYVKHNKTRSIQCPNIKALSIENKDYIIVGDYTLPHSVNQRPLDRLFILNLKEGSIVSSPMSHGYGSNSNCPREYRVSCGHRGTKCMIPSTLTNRSGSGGTSRGFYLTQEPYRSGRDTFRGGSPRSRGANALRLEGLYHGVNHNARSRAIVFHRASYYSNACSSSAGCPAIKPGVFEQYKDKLKGTRRGGALMYLHTLDDEREIQPDC